MIRVERVVGIFDHRDVEFAADRNRPVKDHARHVRSLRVRRIQFPTVLIAHQIKDGFVVILSDLIEPRRKGLVAGVREIRIGYERAPARVEP